MRALVSGGSSGIGASACVRLAEAALARGEQPMIAVCGLERPRRTNTLFVQFSRWEVPPSRWWVTSVTPTCQVNLSTLR